MSDTNPDRLKSVELDADISVLGDDANSEPKVPPIGGAPRPSSGEGLAQATRSDGEGPTTGSSDGLEQRRVENEAIRDVVDDYGKG